VKTYDPHKSTNEVRQASPRKMNFRVLIVSLIGILIAFAALYVVYNYAVPAPTA
jgi:hypothetical protein